MSPTKLPTPRKTRSFSPGRLFRNPLGAAAAISFSLTFVVAGILFATGVIPPHTIAGLGEIDTGVVMLFVPLCALTFAIMAEVVRSILRDGLRHQPKPRAANPLAAWKPGTGEG
jgi:hypothetical protein